MPWRHRNELFSAGIYEQLSAADERMRSGDLALDSFAQR
jgi:hypothetical protein